VLDANDDIALDAPSLVGLDAAEGATQDGPSVIAFYGIGNPLRDAGADVTDAPSDAPEDGSG
jgi:hypothetical protein